MEVCNEIEKVLNDSREKLVIFTSKYCEACKKIFDVDIKKLGIDEKDIPDEAVMVDVDDCHKLADRFNIEKVPTLAIVKEGEIKKILF